MSKKKRIRDIKEMMKFKLNKNTKILKEMYFQKLNY